MGGKKRKRCSYWLKLHELQISASTNKVKCNHTMLVRMAYGCFKPQWCGWVVTKQTTRPAQPTYLPTSPLHKKFAKPFSISTNLTSHINSEQQKCISHQLSPTWKSPSWFLIVNFFFSFSLIFIWHLDSNFIKDF